MFLDKNTHITRKAIVALVLATTIWGFSVPVLKWILGEVPVFTLAFFRFFIASFFLYAIFRPNLKLFKKDIRFVIIAALVGITFHIPIFFLGLKLSSSINAGVIATFSPVLVMMAAAIFLKEKITRSLIIAAILGTIGVFIIIGGPLLKEGLSPKVIGNVLLLISIMFGVAFEIMSKKLFKTYKPMTITFYAFFIGGALIFPFMMLTGQFPTAEMIQKPEFYLGVPYGIIFPSIIAYALWQWGLSKLPASRVGFFVYLDPFIAGIVAFFIFGEAVELQVILGGILILMALYFAESKHPYHHLIHVFRKPETEYPHK